MAENVSESLKSHGVTVVVAQSGSSELPARL